VDETETLDLAEKYPKIVSKIESIMKNEHMPSNEFPIPVID